MSKLAIAFSVVLFASAGNAFSWTGTLQDIQKNVQEVTDTVISKIEIQFESTQAKAAAEIVQLEDETNKFGSKISDELSSISQNFDNEMKKLGDEAGQEIIKGCIEPDDKTTLAHLSEAVMTKTGECVANKLDSGVEYVERIKNVSNEVLDKIVGIKEKARHCGDDVADSKSAFWAIFCSKSTAANATWTSMKAAPKLAASWTKLKYLLVTIQPSLNICTKDERNNLQRKSSLILKHTKECVEQKLAEKNHPKVHKSEEDFA